MITIEDIKRLNYISYSSFRMFVKNPHHLIVCYALFLAKCLVFIILGIGKKRTLNEILFVAFTINNRKSIKTIIENMSNVSYSTWKNPRFDIPKGLIYLRSLKYFPLFQRFYNSSTYEDKRLIRTFYDSFMATCGYCEIYDKMLKNNPQLKLIIFANDHSIESRCLLDVAEKHGVKTLYVQHASITERFPPLHFTYSFLDGIESYAKYKSIGDIKGRIFLTGSPRFDELYKYKNGLKTHDIGIALNSLDLCEKVMELCKYLQKHVSKKIIVRPHPSMGKLFDAPQFKNAGFEISDSTIESSFSFLSKVKYLVANESSIHLDAALMGVPSLLFNFSDGEVYDWYSYIKNGLIQLCDSYNDVIKVLKSHPLVPIKRVRFYNASIQTPIEGEVGSFIANFITKLITNSEAKAFQAINEVMFLNKYYYELSEFPLGQNSSDKDASRF